MSRIEFHQKLYVLIVAVLSAATVLSHFLMGLCTFLLLLNWLSEWNWKEKVSRIRHNKFCLPYAAFYLVFAIGLVNSTNLHEAAHEMLAYLIFLFAPIIIVSSKQLDDRELEFIFMTFVFATLFGCVWNLLYALSHDLQNYREMSRFIDHIRFGLCVVFSIVLSVYFSIKIKKSVIRVLCLFSAVVLVAYLLISQTLSAIFFVFIVGIAFLTKILLESENKTLKNTVFIAGTAVFIAVIAYFGYITHSYFHPKDANPDFNELTSNGNPYTFDENSIVENGYHIDYYVCDAELRRAWTQRSDSNYTELTASTLKRYLNSLGMKKDSLSVMLLTDSDIENIEDHCANVVYSKKLNIRKALYQTFFGFSLYEKYGYVSESSLLERVELWKTSLELVRERPLFGYGIGNERKVLDKKLVENGSQIANKKQNRGSHNQFLSFWLASGLIPMLYFVFLLFLPIVRFRRKMPFVFVSLCLILILSMFFEDTLNSQTGRMLFTVFLPLLLFSDTYNQVDKSTISEL